MKTFFNSLHLTLFFLLHHEAVSNKIATSTEKNKTSEMGLGNSDENGNSLINMIKGITNTSSSEEVLAAVNQVGNNNLSAGIDKIIGGLSNEVQYQIDHLDETLKDLGLANTDALLYPLLGSISSGIGVQIDKKDSAKTLLTLALKSNLEFLTNSTKALYKNVFFLDQFATQLHLSKADPIQVLTILLGIIDECYTMFQKYDITLADSLKQLLNANKLHTIDVELSTGVTLIKVNNNLMTDYGNLIDKSLKLLSDAEAGKYEGDSMDDVVNNLQSVKNRDKIAAEVEKTIEDIQNEIGDKKYGVSDVMNALKSKNLFGLVTILRNLELQIGLVYLKGVNDVSKTKVLENIAKNVNKLDPKTAVGGLGALMKGISDRWNPSLVNILKGEMISITNPSIDGLFQIGADYFTSVGTQLTQIVKDLEASVNAMAENIPGNSEGSGSGSQNGGSSGNNDGSHWTGGNSGAEQNSDECSCKEK